MGKVSLMLVLLLLFSLLAIVWDAQHQVGIMKFRVCFASPDARQLGHMGDAKDLTYKSGCGFVPWLLKMTLRPWKFEYAISFIGDVRALIRTLVPIY